jgi:hypothetical protein
LEKAEDYLFPNEVLCANGQNVPKTKKAITLENIITAIIPLLFDSNFSNSNITQVPIRMPKALPRIWRVHSLTDL